MARQSTTPVSFARSVRKDTSVLMSSGRAGVVMPVGYFPLLPGDSASGSVGIDVQLKEMPKPLLNAVHANVQAWFVPKSAMPHFSGRDELMHAMTGKNIKALAQADRSPPPYFRAFSGNPVDILKRSEFARALGLHFPAGASVQPDLVDAYNLVYNFRLSAHSSKLKRRPYVAEGIEAASKLAPAFWPSSRFVNVVPDYERALLVGSLDLDVAAGRLPVKGLVIGGAYSYLNTSNQHSVDAQGNPSTATWYDSPVRFVKDAITNVPNVFAEMQSFGLNISLADIDKARTTQAFAKLRTAYAGNNATGFDNDDTIVSLLMQGISVPSDHFKRPWLLDSKRVPVGFAERFATDAANLDASVTLGRASAQLSINIPAQDVGGVVIFTLEVLPERIDERQSDEWLHYTRFDDLPNALRDVQRVEPVDLVKNRRIDAAHAQPDGLYGYEPMNNVWNRNFTRLGGVFYQPNAGAGWTENRSNIWQTEIVNPTFSATHYLAPSPFPHSVFSDPTGDAFEVVCRHMVSITGLTQIGDVLVENNDDFQAVADAG